MMRPDEFFCDTVDISLSIEEDQLYCKNEMILEKPYYLKFKFSDGSTIKTNNMRLSPELTAALHERMIKETEDVKK